MLAAAVCVIGCLLIPIPRERLLLEYARKVADIQGWRPPETKGGYYRLLSDGLSTRHRATTPDHQAWNNASSAVLEPSFDRSV
jgi:hypothetical protein